MEYVQGRSLADVIASSPLSPGQTATIGVEIAEALAEAHQHGIVHRDIKAENIVLMPSGHVKVLDFGLAKWTGERGAIDDRITTDGMVVGTSRAMSPEQALGRDIDGRSDIFSLGSLLYELASGRPAFRGTTPIETMHKIAGVKYEPLTTVAPGTPDALAAVIERCLARDPSDRYQKAEQVAHELRRVAATATGASVTQPGFRSSQILVRARGHLLTLIGVAAVVTTVAVTGVMLGWFGVKKPLAVAVLPVESPALSDVAGLASTAIEDAIVTNLARMKNVIVVSGRDVRAVSSKGKRVQAIARELGVRELVETSLTPGQPGRPIRVNLQRLEGATGRVIWSEQLEVGTDDLMLLQDRIVTALGDAYRGVPTSGHPGSQDATPAALKAYLQAKSRIDSGKYSKDFREEIALLERATADAPRFLAPVTLLAGSYRYLHGMYHRSADADRCTALAERAHELAPDHPWVLSLEVRLALDRRDNATALERARAWTASRPGDSTAWEILAVVLGRMDRYREADAAFERSLALLPSWHTFFSLAQSRESRGDFDGARDAIRRALAISPGNLFLLGLLAEVEMYAGKNTEAERLYRDLLTREGTRLDRIHLGNCLYYQGKLAEAAALYREAADKDPTDYLALGNLADTQLALGQTNLTKASYAEALRLCDAEYAQGLRRRALLETRARCLAQLGRGPEAVLAIQEALSDYPDNPATMFMAALVAAVAGDTNAALAWTGKALAAHAPVVWFTGPEFARLASDPRFRALTSER
jgi:serine/threonine-protein kinase